MRKTLMAGAAILALSTGAASAYDMSDASRIVDASKNNAARFDRDYKGRQFEDTLTFTSVTDTFLLGTRLATFNGAYCDSFEDASALARAADWNSGQRVAVAGTIETTSLGTLVLSNCRFGGLEAAPAPAPVVIYKTVTVPAEPVRIPDPVQPPAPVYPRNNWVMKCNDDVMQWTGRKLFVVRGDGVARDFPVYNVQRDGAGLTVRGRTRWGRVAVYFSTSSNKTRIFWHSDQGDIVQGDNGECQTLQTL